MEANLSLPLSAGRGYGAEVTDYLCPGPLHWLLGWQNASEGGVAAPDLWSARTSPPATLPGEVALPRKGREDESMLLGVKPIIPT